MPLISVFPEYPDLTTPRVEGGKVERGVIGVEIVITSDTRDATSYDTCRKWQDVICCVACTTWCLRTDCNTSLYTGDFETGGENRPNGESTPQDTMS